MFFDDFNSQSTFQILFTGEGGVILTDGFWFNLTNSSQTAATLIKLSQFQKEFLRFVVKVVGTFESSDNPHENIEVKPIESRILSFRKSSANQHALALRINLQFTVSCQGLKKVSKRFISTQASSGKWSLVEKWKLND